MPNPVPTEVRTALASLLRRRIELIADHAFRDRDAQGHLQALRSISNEIEALRPAISGDPRLAHFLERCSYDKALAWLDSELATKV